MGRVEGKVAIVTGGASGIGKASAGLLVREGARVVIADLNEVDGQKVADELGERAAFVRHDVTDESAWQSLIADTEARLGKLDVLVNNAGISGMEQDPALPERLARSAQQAAELAAGGPIVTHTDATVEMTDEQWQRMLAVHMNGTFYCSREALKIMGPALSGSIINMGSIMGTAGGAGNSAYCAAKAGILGFTRSLAREVVTRNIRVNAIAPGWIDTDMTAPLGDYRQMIAMQTPMGRFGTPDDIAWAAVYLASEEAGFVTGQVLSPNGGWHMSQ